MKTTGIVRRIDELGRVVIPKELRRTMHIKEGEELEVFVEQSDTLILKKYSAVKAMKDFSKEYAEILYSHTGNTVLVCDNDTFIATSTDKNGYLDKPISKVLYNFLDKRKSAYITGGNIFAITNDPVEYKDMAVCPIIYNGDILGGIIMINRQNNTVGDVALSLIEVAAGFLAKQLN